MDAVEIIRMVVLGGGETSLALLFVLVQLLLVVLNAIFVFSRHFCHVLFVVALHDDELR